MYLILRDVKKIQVVRSVYLVPTLLLESVYTHGYPVSKEADNTLLSTGLQRPIRSHLLLLVCDEAYSCLPSARRRGHHQSPRISGTKPVRSSCTRATVAAIDATLQREPGSRSDAHA